MKTTLSSPAPNEGSGSGSGQGKGRTPAAIQRGNALKASAATNGPRYGGATYDSGEHYVVGDPVTPVNEGAYVKMGLETRNNDNLQAFLAHHITQMTGNPNFTTPVPAAPDLLALYTAFQSAQANVLSLKTALDDGIAARNASRVALVEAMNLRAAYVQTASNGNRQVIISSGLEVRNARTPVGQLPAPVDLTADLNGVAGVVKLRWKPVPYARGYLVECSLNVQPRVFTLLANTTKASAEKQLTTGETYVFRVAASGGSTGQSYWSPEVIRGAA